jgi:hypothetical protein
VDAPILKHRDRHPLPTLPVNITPFIFDSYPFESASASSLCASGIDCGAVTPAPPFIFLPPPATSESTNNRATQEIFDMSQKEQNAWMKPIPVKLPHIPPSSHSMAFPLLSPSPVSSENDDCGRSLTVLLHHFTDDGLDIPNAAAFYDIARERLPSQPQEEPKMTCQIAKLNPVPEDLAEPPEDIALKGSNGPKKSSYFSIPKKITATELSESKLNSTTSDQSGIRSDGNDSASSTLSITDVAPTRGLSDKEAAATSNIESNSRDSHQSDLGSDLSGGSVAPFTTIDVETPRTGLSNETMLLPPGLEISLDIAATKKEPPTLSTKRSRSLDAGSLNPVKQTVTRPENLGASNELLEAFSEETLIEGMCLEISLPDSIMHNSCRTLQIRFFSSLFLR